MLRLRKVYDHCWILFATSSSAENKEDGHTKNTDNKEDGHTKNKDRNRREGHSTEDKHQKGDARRQADQKRAEVSVEQTRQPSYLRKWEARTGGTPGSINASHEIDLHHWFDQGPLWQHLTAESLRGCAASS